ncbi:MULTISPECIES: hypothetical protein [unclassified Pseudarthrobacter]|uniref:hypothetical protein n=1 Tax=unclassified Pseudarthrobacter TaxID=2647000 RepID=UPI0030772F12
MDYDSRFAESMRRDATARLVALEAYPMWRSLASAYGAYLGLVMAVAVGFEIGEVYPVWAPERLWFSADIDLFPGMRLAGFILILGGVIELVRVGVNRHRVARQYLKAEEITRGRIVVVNSDQSRSIESAQGPLEITLGGWLALTAFSLGVYLVTILLTATLVSGGDPMKPGDPYLPYAIFGFSFGSVLTLFGGLSVLPLIQDEKETWKHPRTLGKSASVVRTDGGTDRRQQEVRPRWWRSWKHKGPRK